MLLCLPRKYHSEDDDYAPVDYNYVGSVAEGERRRQGEAIHREADRATVRHRVDPNAPAEDAATEGSAAGSGAPRGLEAARRMPRAGDPAPAASVAYPRPRDNAFAHTPTYAPEAAPVLGTDEARSPRRAQSPARAPEPTKEEDARFAPPAEGEMPDWLRAARQNNMPLYDERRASARPAVQPERAPEGPPPTDLLGRPIARTAPTRAQNATPMTADEYAAAGYPPELIAQKMSEDDRLRMAMGVGRKRHGAQLAAPPPRDPARVQRMEGAPAPYDRQEGYARRQAQGGQVPQGGMDYAPRARRAAYVNGQDGLDGPPYGDGSDAGMPPYGTPAGRYAPRGGYAGGDGYQDTPANNGYTPQGSYPRQAVAIRREAYTPQSGAPDGWQQPAQGGYAPQGGYDPRDPYASGYAASRQNPYQGETDEDEADEEPKPRPRIPYLGIGTFVAALALVLLWILRMTYASQTEGVLAAREAAQASLVNKHPYDYRELIEREAAANNLHPAFVAAIVLNESSFNPQAESDVGARGLMQMMPDTAEWVHGKIGDTSEYSFDRMYDPDTNVRYACWYLAFLSDRFRGDPVLVAAAFHAGQNTVQNWLNDSRYSADSTSIKLENMADGPTKTYATRVLKAFAAYRRLYYEGGLEAVNAAATDANAADPAA